MRPKIKIEMSQTDLQSASRRGKHWPDSSDLQRSTIVSQKFGSYKFVQIVLDQCDESLKG